MIKDISLIKHKSLTYIKDFMKNCTVEEKIDAHYVNIDIISKNELRIKKSNGNTLDRIDLILNSMWSNIVLDWNYLKLINKDWFDNHVGYTISLFYLPCDTPIIVQYNSDIRYIFDRVVYKNNIINTHDALKDLKFPDTYKICYKSLLDKANDFEQIINNIKLPDNNIDSYIYENFESIINTHNNRLLAIGMPEGYIFKWNKQIYQITYNHTKNDRKIVSEKTSYEFLLCDFIQYCKSKNYHDKITQGYTKTICNLFNDYIINWEKVNNNIFKNIDIQSLQSPYLGTYFDIGYDYIPDPITKNLCINNELYKNIFKILLANLRKGKDYKFCIYMNKKQALEWNNIVKNIKIHTIYI